MSYKPRLDNVTRTVRGLDRVWHVRETVYAGDSVVGVRPMSRDHNGKRYFLVCIGTERYPDTTRQEYVREDRLVTRQEIVA